MPQDETIAKVTNARAVFETGTRAGDLNILYYHIIAEKEPDVTIFHTLAVRRDDRPRTTAANS